MDTELAAGLAREPDNIQSNIDILTRHRDAIQAHLAEARLATD
ncbi:hypothetical protein [Streptomyces sp. SID3343]